MPNTSVRDFFTRYARVTMGPEPEQLAEFYDDSFVAAGPKGSAAFKNDELFLKWLRDVRAFNEKTGMTSMHVVGVEEIPLGSKFRVANVTWGATFERLRDRTIPFTISYVLRVTDGGFKVIAYVSHEDQEEAMRRHGL
jgi:hypothetical protein